MKVLVKTLDNIILPINVEPSGTVETLKLQIENTIGLGTHYQRLIFNGRKLDERFTLSHYNIENESLIHMTHRLRDRTAN